MEHHLLCSGCVKALYDHDAPYEELVLAVAFAEVMPEDTLGVELRENLRNRGISEAQFAQDIKKFIEQHMQ